VILFQHAQHPQSVEFVGYNGVVVPHSLPRSLLIIQRGTL